MINRGRLFFDIGCLKKARVGEIVHFAGISSRLPLYFSSRKMEEAAKKKSWFPWFKGNLMKTTNGMAIGLFGTLIIGTIIDLFAKIPNMEQISVWSAAIKGLMGAGIGLGVALSLKRDGVSVVAITSAGFVGNYAFHWITNEEFGLVQWKVTSIGDPLSCYIAAILAVVALKYILRRKTPVDMILIPLIGILAAMAYSFLLAEWVHFITIGISKLIEISFGAVPFLMCIIISALMGMALTAPISSVAICVAIKIGTVPLAAASALIGCCVQMVGFAVHTARDNKWGSVLAVGLGTSMLQFKNIIRKPLVWVPTIVVSAILGPFAMLFPLSGVDASMASNLSVGAGMGTSGLVGPLNFLGAIGYDNWQLWVLLLGVCIAGPIVLVFLLDLLFRKLKWIEAGDFSLKNEI